jgi:hypothetical protein
MQLAVLVVRFFGNQRAAEHIINGSHGFLHLS